MLDVGLPGISGLELQAVLVKRAVVIPIIILTGNGDVSMVALTMKLGAFDFIEKPFRSEAPPSSA